MSVVHRADLAVDETTPTLLQGYGAAGTVEPPVFRHDFLAWIAGGGYLSRLASDLEEDVPALEYARALLKLLHEYAGSGRYPDGGSGATVTP